MPKKNNDRGTGFAAPISGRTAPKGTKVKKNKDGTITLVEPKKKK